MADYIPSGDADFNTWQQNFISIISANPSDFGFSTTELAPLLAKQAAWTSTYAANTTAQQSAKAASQAKEEARDEYEKGLRVAWHGAYRGTTLCRMTAARSLI